MPDSFHNGIFYDKFMLSSAGKKTLLAPDANEEYLIYQTLLGVWPTRSDEDTKDVIKRVQVIGNIFVLYLFTYLSISLSISISTCVCLDVYLCMYI